MASLMDATAVAPAVSDVASTRIEYILFAVIDTPD
jgi:hypothetical protein